MKGPFNVDAAKFPRRMGIEVKGYANRENKQISIDTRLQRQERIKSAFESERGALKFMFNMLFAVVSI